MAIFLVVIRDRIQAQDIKIYRNLFRGLKIIRQFVSESGKRLYPPRRATRDSFSTSLKERVKDRRVGYSEDFENFSLFHIPFTDNDFWNFANTLRQDNK